MTPTTTEQAKVNPWWVDELTLHWGHGHSSHDTRRAAKTAIDQVEALTKERDEYAKAADTMAMQHKVERDELRMQIDSLCHEVAAIPAIKEERDALAMANRDLINWFDALKADHDKLAAAAKLALDALNKHGSPYLGHIDEYQQGAEALRQAGVQ